MTFDNILANPPYGDIGTEIASTMVYHAKEWSYLGTPSMVKVNCHKVSAWCVYIESYVLQGSFFERLDWVNQTIWLAHNGECIYLPKKTKTGVITSPWNVRVGFSMHYKGWNTYMDKNKLVSRNPETSDILNVGTMEERDTIVKELTEKAPYNHKAMVKWGFMAYFKNKGE